MTIKTNGITIQIADNEIIIKKENITEHCEGFSAFPVKLEINIAGGIKIIPYDHQEPSTFDDIHSIFFSEEEDEMVSAILNKLM